MKSDFGKINARDFGRGLLVSIIPVAGQIIGYLYPIFDKGEFPSKEMLVNLSAKAIGWTLLSAGGYLGVNVLTNKDGKLGK